MNPAFSEKFNKGFKTICDKEASKIYIKNYHIQGWEAGMNPALPKEKGKAG